MLQIDQRLPQAGATDQVAMSQEEEFDLEEIEAQLQELEVCP